MGPTEKPPTYRSFDGFVVNPYDGHREASDDLKVPCLPREERTLDPNWPATDLPKDSDVATTETMMADCAALITASLRCAATSAAS